MTESNEATSPALSPDGRFIVASIANGQKLLLFDVRQDFRGEVLEEGFAWMGLTPDGSPLLMRDTGSQEVYSLDFEIP